MSSTQSLSRPEKWIRLASWLVALVFAGFLIALGNLVISDLFYVPQGGPPKLSVFEKQAGVAALEQQHTALQQQTKSLQNKQELLSETRAQLERHYQTQRKGLANWLASSEVSGDANQHIEVKRRTLALDELQAQILSWQQKEDQLNQQLITLRQQQTSLTLRMDQHKEHAYQQYQQALQSFELKVFALRLAVVLPLLLLAVWLFIRYRQHRYWFFVYGFGLFSLFAFFVELLPYLPSFGGYVRLIVGIALTVFAGMRMIQAFQRYAEHKRQELQQSQSSRAQQVLYTEALSAYQKKNCPSCEHQYNIAGEDADYCIHCGLQLFKICGCNARNFAFFPFCKKCGSPVKAQASTDLPNSIDERANHEIR
ncbi:serine endopeptidase [Neisseriaceae bacterium TC5R-5]|nr:serine endopeptidase [Neisseriaceae bacterium TC5R-5]